MDDPRAQRTLVKSPPELWAEVSDLGALAGHLAAFGEIRITRLQPETTVAWEGDRACGTVALEPAGWGTKVTLTARVGADAAGAGGGADGAGAGEGAQPPHPRRGGGRAAPPAPRATVVAVRAPAQRGAGDRADTAAGPRAGGGDDRRRSG